VTDNGRRKSMRVKEAMTGTPYYCQLDTNLGSAVELMWAGNCGFLPVMGPKGKIVGVVTDRDICIALGTRNRLPGDVTVGEVMSGRLFACSPDDDVHIALQLMKEGGVRRLPVVAGNGSLVGVISMDDLLVRAETPGIGSRPELSIEEVVRTYRAIDQHRTPQIVLARGAA
jgi:CBS domain-containing protein